MQPGNGENPSKIDSEVSKSNPLGSAAETFRRAASSFKTNAQEPTSPPGDNADLWRSKSWEGAKAKAALIQEARIATGKVSEESRHEIAVYEASNIDPMSWSYLDEETLDAFIAAVKQVELAKKEIGPNTEYEVVLEWRSLGGGGRYEPVASRRSKEQPQTKKGIVDRAKDIIFSGRYEARRSYEARIGYEARGFSYEARLGGYEAARSVPRDYNRYEPRITDDSPRPNSDEK